MTQPTHINTSSTAEASDDPEVAPDGRPSIRTLLPSLRGTAAWVVLTVLTVALDGWTGVVVSVGIAAALLAGVRPRALTAAGVVCAALVPVWVLSQGSVTASDVTPALVTESLVPHHLAFAALVLMVVSVVLQAGRPPVTDAASLAPEPIAGPLGGAGTTLRVVGVALAVVLAVVVCVAAWQT